MVDHFTYQAGQLYAENVPVTRIAQEVGTPCYIYSTATLQRHYRVFSEGFGRLNPLICFAVKANSNLAVLQLLAQEGAGADTVSEGEIRRALAAGIAPEKIVFSGVGKTRDEMAFALKTGIFQFNVESKEELDDLQTIAQHLDKKAPVALRINPDIAGGGHDKISTGRKTDKFGIAWEQATETYAYAGELSHIQLQGITTHIGSQLTDLAPFRAAFLRVVELVSRLRAQGQTVTTLDLGGGLGIPYHEEAPPLPAEYAAMITPLVQDLDVQLLFEPGRLIAGNAGILLSQTIRTKHTPNRDFAIIDAAMNDLMRPSLYDAAHHILPVQEANATAQYDVVGPVCESADVFARNVPLPPLQAGDLLYMRSAGAYGAVMSNSYNSRLLVPEVLVDGEDYRIIRSRPSYDDLLALDNLT